MATWVVSPEKFLAPYDVHRLRRVLGNAATLARARGVQAAFRDQLIIELALGTGLRVSELSNLKVEDLFLKKGQNSLLVRNGKGGKDRIVQFSPGLKKLIQEYLDYRNTDSPFLFPSQRNPHMTASGIQQVFKRLDPCLSQSLSTNGANALDMLDGIGQAEAGSAGAVHHAG